MAVRNLPVRALNGEHLIAESNGTMARSEVLLAANADYPSGLILGKITATGQYCPLANTGSDGSQTPAGILFLRKQRSTGTQRAVVHNRQQSDHNLKKVIFPAGADAARRAAIVAALDAIGVRVLP